MFLNRHALRAFREIRNLTVTDMARTAGIKQPHLSNIEAGRRKATPELIQTFAHALGVPVLAITSPVEEPITRKDTKKARAVA